MQINHDRVSAIPFKRALYFEHSSVLAETQLSGGGGLAI
jgi:hypothetical protein